MTLHDFREDVVVACIEALNQCRVVRGGRSRSFSFRIRRSEFDRRAGGENGRGHFPRVPDRTADLYQVFAYRREPSQATGTMQKNARESHE
jgi:hypothetical protein